MVIMIHDLAPMTVRARDEVYVKSQLRDRMNKSKQVIVLVGESTKDLRNFVPWEIELAHITNC
jgi:Thoeris protein ThsB, TIR-like domain